MRASIWNDNTYEYARELQLTDYLSKSNENEELFAECEVCGCSDNSECVFVNGGYCLCEECISSEMSENDCSRKDAIKTLTVLCNTISRLYKRPKSWKAFLMDGMDRVEAIPEALEFLSSHCPKTHYLHSITSNEIEGDSENLMYHLSWRQCARQSN